MLAWRQLPLSSDRSDLDEPYEPLSSSVDVIYIQPVLISDPSTGSGNVIVFH